MGGSANAELEQLMSTSGVDSASQVPECHQTCPRQFPSAVPKLQFLHDTRSVKYAGERRTLPFW